MCSKKKAPGKVVRVQRCQVCVSPDRAAVEQGLANGISCAVLGSRYDLHKDAVWRHGNKHMDATTKKRLMVTGSTNPVDLRQLRLDESESLLHHLRAVRVKIFRGLDYTAEMNDWSKASNLMAQAHKNADLVAKLVGDLKVGRTVINNNLILTNEYHRLRTGLVQALKPYPEARRAVAELLRNIEQTEVIEHESGG